MHHKSSRVKSVLICLKALTRPTVGHEQENGSKKRSKSTKDLQKIDMCSLTECCSSNCAETIPAKVFEMEQNSFKTT